MRTALLVALAVVLIVPTIGCRSVPPIVETEGPDVVEFMVKTGTRWALAEKQATPEQALRIRGYILQARALIEDGSAPAGALDELAAYLNTHIDNELVRRAIQQGIEFVKSSVTIPVDGLIPAEVKVWVFAVLDGAAQGCAEYASMGRDPRAVPSIGAPDVISFR